jgi:hypothetical protein
LQIPSSIQLTEKEHKLHPQSQLKHHHKNVLTISTDKIIHSPADSIIYLHLFNNTVRKIKDPIDIFDSNLFLLYFIFFLQFFEEVTHRESYAVPNSKNIHIPTPRE